MLVRRLIRFSLVPLVVVVASPMFASVLGVASVRSTGPCEASPTTGGSHDGRPFGNLEGIITGGNVTSNQASIRGWSLADGGVDVVEILVDGGFDGRAEYGIARPDVGDIFNDFPGSVLSGFRYILDTTRFLNGSHKVSARVISKNGQLADLNTVEIFFDNVSHNLVPFGGIDFPRTQSQLFGNCNLADSDRHYTVVSGWALDAGVEANDEGVGYVELLIDGSIFANSRLNCVFDPVLGPFTNCYGQPRFDIEQNFRGLKDTPNSGFRFVMDIGALIAAGGYSEGAHTLTIRVGDQDDGVANIGAINTVFRCELPGNQGSFGFIDRAPESLNSKLTVLSGWALDREGVHRVRVVIDGRGSTDDATYGFPRPEVNNQYPGFLDSNAPGWMFPLDSAALTDGLHTAVVQVIDNKGKLTIIGQIHFGTQNP